MNTTLTYNQALDLLPLYVLGALEPEEMLAMEQYLQDQRGLFAALEAAEEATARLALLAPHAPLPADARDRLLARARADIGQVPAAPPPLALPTAVPAEQAQAPIQTPSPAAAPTARATGWPAARRWTWRLAGALAIVLLLFYVGQLQQQLSQATAQIERLSTQAADEQAALGLLANAELVVPVPGTGLAPAARGTFYQRNDQAVFVAEGLPPLPADKTYQLWLVVDGQPTPVGLLENPSLAAPSVVIVLLPPGLRNFAIVDVSVERAGGSETITKETIVLRGQVEL